MGAGPTQWARPSPALSLLFRLGMRSTPSTCPSNKCDGCFYLEAFNKPDSAAQECFALHKSSQISKMEKNICESEGRPRAAGSTSWIIGAQIRKLHESPIQESCPGTVHGPVKLFNAGREAFVSTDMPLATLSLGKYFRYQKIQFCETSQQFPATRRRCEHFPSNDTGGGPGSGSREANKQTGTILISRRDIPLPSSLGDCHAQVEAACIIAQSRRQNLRAASTQCISTTKYTRGTRHISTQYLRRVKLIHRSESMKNSLLCDQEWVLST